MRKITSHWFGLILSLFAVLGLGFYLTAGAADLATLSPGLASAESVQEGAKVEGILKNGETDNFKIDLRAGYQLRAFGSATKNGQADSKLIINVLNAQGAKLSSSQVVADGMANAEAFFYKGLTQVNSTNPETVYIEVKSEGAANGGLNYKVSFEKADRSDAEANTDAGDQLTSALDLQLTAETVNFEKNFIGKNPCGSSEQPKYCSTDDKDIYTFSLVAGKTASLQIVPSAKLNLTAALLDQNNNVLKTVNGSSDGAILSIDYNSTANQQVYLEISSPAPSFFGSYSLQFSQTAGTTSVSPTPGTTTAPSYSPTETPATSPSNAGFDFWAYKNYFIIGGIIIVVIVVLWLVLSMMRKKQAQTSTADIEKLRQQMKGTSTPAPVLPGKPKPVPAMGLSRTMHTDMKRLTPNRPVSRPAVSPRPNPSVAPRRSVGSAQPTFMPAVKRPAPVPADSDIGTFPRKAPAPNSLPTASSTAPVSTKPPVPSTPSRPNPPPIPTRPLPAGTSTPPVPSRMDEKAKADIDQIFGA